MPAGRPTKYTEDFVRIAYEVMSLGATVEKLAKVINVNPDTIYQWQKKYPEFSESLQRGRDHFDSEIVEQALFKRAVGYNYKIKTYLHSEDRLILIKFVEKHMPPSVEAIRFWLSNRNPKRWGLRAINSDQKLFYTNEDVQRMLREEEPILRKLNLE
jgi:transposase-like protein